VGLTSLRLTQHSSVGAGRRRLLEDHHRHQLHLRPSTHPAVSDVRPSREASAWMEDLRSHNLSSQFMFTTQPGSQRTSWSA
jgi:hypothetical protein